MLASEPRMLTGGGISVRVNGATLTPLDSGKGAKSENDWTKTTIMWRNGAKHYSDDGVGNGASSSSVNIEAPPPQLVHVIRVKATDMEQQPKIQFTSNPVYAKPSQTDYCKNKISVVVGSSPIGNMIKGEDERSSSGASSAPGSDCERSDSDREADDGTDSGFSPSRRHCARISVNTNNNFSSLTSDSSNSDSYEVVTRRNVVCNGKNNDVRLTIAAYADKEPEDRNGSVTNGSPWDMHFHLRELDAQIPANKQPDAEDVQSKIAAAHAMLTGHDGGPYSLKNKVRSSIVSLLVQSATNRNYDQEETGRIVFYTTSMGIVRTTYEKCRKVRKILETLMVKFEERDVFMNRGFQQEVRERLGATRVIVPQVFVEGRHLGNAEIVEQLNEIGHLRELLRPYKRQSVGGTCQQCGGYRYLLCPICGGSKKSMTHRHHFYEDLVALRCVTCDESGLIRCPQCINGEG